MKQPSERQELDQLIALYERMIQTGREIDGQPIRMLRLSALKVDLTRLRHARQLANRRRRSATRLKVA